MNRQASIDFRTAGAATPASRYATWRGLALLMGCASIAAAMPVALAATPTCFGQPATIVGRDQIRGTAGDDVIVGKGGSDTIRGLGGDDLICGRGGYDTLIGGYGNDKLAGNGQSDTLNGGEGHDRLKGGAVFDFLEGGPGDDIIGSKRSSWHDIAVYENSPRAVRIDLEEGTAKGDGTDTLIGIHFLELSAFNDVVEGTNRKEVIRDSGGGDSLTLKGGNDFVYPPVSDEPDGNDLILLGPGDDFANSGAGDDHIDGGDGNDAVNAGEGTDNCVNTEDEGDCEN